MFRPLIEAIRVESSRTEEGVVGDVVDKILPRRAEKKAALKADNKRRDANWEKNKKGLRDAVARIKTRH